MAYTRIGSHDIAAGTASVTFTSRDTGQSIGVGDSVAARAAVLMIEEIERLRDENQRLKDRPPVAVTLTDEAARVCEVRAERATELFGQVSELFGTLERCVQAVGGGSTINSIEAARGVPGCVATQFGAMKTARDEACTASREANTKIVEMRTAIRRAVKRFRDGDFIAAIEGLSDLVKL